jgi:hypothetical protein
MMNETATVLVLKHPKGADGDLDGYAFEDAKHADKWLSQQFARDGGYSYVKVTATASSRMCGCCGGMHWWMTWRGKRVRVGGAWRPPSASSVSVDDGEE